MDTIADMINRIKSGSVAGKSTVSFPYSRFKLAIAELLVKEGYLKSVNKVGKKITKSIEAELVYNEAGEPKIQAVKRISKSSKRVYQQAKNLRSVRQGQGIMLVSTPKGVMTASQAKKEKVGGEALFLAW